jgi:hypothetical protein
MSKIQELKEKHKTEIEALQKSCPHIKYQWLPFQWAPGHYDGEVLVCEECEKILEKRPFNK